MWMHAISLWEPWATLMRLGVKTIETRNWHPPGCLIGKPLLICAARRWTHEQEAFLWRPEVQQALLTLRPRREYALTRSDLPLGMAVCIVTLVRATVTSLLRDRISPVERLFGDYSDYTKGNRRYGWETDRLINGFEPFPVKGAQGVFRVELPAELEHLVQAA